MAKCKSICKWRSFSLCCIRKNAYNALAGHQILLQIPTFWHLSGLNKTFKGQVFEVSRGSMNFKPAKEIKRRYFLKNELEKSIFIFLHFKANPLIRKFRQLPQNIGAQFRGMNADPLPPIQNSLRIIYEHKMCLICYIINSRPQILTSTWCN